ncbi:transposase family protein [Streptomyces sp. NPDC093111]|uniref:transposase family protein n=1 Tax=Streptomyces sp. NPDC093111 TaxID=3154978 RepID=UPI003423CF13
MPADASSLIHPAFDRLREQSDVGPGQVPGLLERLTQVPDPRDPHGVRHALAVVLTPTAGAVPTGATSLRTGNAPRAMATWRNLAVGALRDAVGSGRQFLCTASPAGRSPRGPVRTGRGSFKKT